MICREPRDEYDRWLFPEPSGGRFMIWVRFMGAVFFLIVLALLTCAGCVRRGQVCITAEHGQVDPNWSRSNNVGASVCADVEPPGE